MKYFLAFAFLSSALAITSCKYEREEEEVTGPIEFCDTAQVTYTTYTKIIIDNSCNSVGCHNAGSAFGDFTTFGGIKVVVDNGQFAKRVFDGNPSFMPIGGFADENDRDILKCWIEQGAKESVR